MICCYKKCKGRITNWFNRIMQADGDNIAVEPHPSAISLFVDTSINKPSAANLMVESDQEDEEDPYSNILDFSLQQLLPLFLLCINQ